MVKLKTVAAAAVLLATSGIHADARPAHGISTKIDTLFRVDMLNSNREYVEHLIGPAKYTDATSGDHSKERRYYIVDSCNVEIGYKDGAVTYLGLKGVSLHCRFPLQRFIPHLPPTHVDALSELTFDTFENEVGSGIDQNFYDVECLGSCGNSADPSVSLFHNGPHVDEFINIMIEQDYPYSDGASDKAFAALEDVLIKREDSDYVAYGRVKCDVKYQPLDRELFKKSHVKNVYVGFDLGDHTPSCRN